MSNLDSLRAPVRTPLAATIFEELAAAILTGALTGVLAPERELAERFGVSRMLVRQGVHRLAEAGLVQVRQGGATKIMDPRECGDLRIIELYYRLGATDAPQWQALRAHVLEKQYTQGLSLLDTFDRNAGKKQRTELAVLAARAPTESYEREFWEAVAQGAGNRILSAEVRWWYHVLTDRPKPRTRSKPAEVHAFYMEIATRLIEGDAVAYYRAALGAAR